MAWDINQTILLGRLTRDPEVSYTKTNKQVCKFSIANNKGNDEVNFFNIIAWEKLAETCAKYLKKGKQVIIVGKLRQDRWKDDEGKNRSKVEVTASTVQFLGSKDDSDGNQEMSGPAQTNINNNGTEEFDGEPLGDDEVPF